MFDIKEVEKEWVKDNISDELVKGIIPTFRLTHKKDDPIAIRISAGSDMANGQYMAYRGNLSEVKTILENCLKVVNAKIKQS